MTAIPLPSRSRRGAAPSEARERPPQVRARPDLVVAPRWIRGRKYWVVKDPVALQYCQLREEEYAVLEMLDGRTSREEIQRRFHERFAPLRLTDTGLQSFLGKLFRSGLVVSSGAGQGTELWRRGRQKRRRLRWQKWTSVLAVRFRGVDPTRMLDGLLPWLGWLFNPPCMIVWAILALSALTLVAVEFDTLRTQLPEFQAFFASRNVIWLGLALAVTKILHELGHALACRRFGGECHELGLMLLVFTPCLYCNVSDAWMLPSKWRRAAIAAAGIYVEVFLASVCTFLWWFSQPGLLNTLCLNTMFVCSVGTLLFNGNPLLRYDGYYVLSDLLEIPNLWQESRRAVYGWLGRWLLGWDGSPADRQAGAPRWLPFLYGLASIAYRGVVLVAICFFLFAVLEPWGLRVVAEMIVGLVVVGVVAMPVIRGTQAIRNPLVRRRVKWGRLVLVGGVLAIVLAAVLSVPLPYGVRAAAVVQPRDARHVYVKVPGRIQEAVAAGREVRRGETIGRLERLDMERQLHRLAAEVSQLTLQLENLESLRLSDPRVAELIPSVRERLVGKRRELTRQQADVDRLTLKAPRDGVVIAPPLRPRPSVEREEELATWWGDPLDPANRGALLDADTLLCLVGDPERLEAMVFIDQADVEFARPGQRVRLLLPAAPGEILTGTLEELAEVDAEDVPRVLAESKWMPTRADASGRLRPLETLYQARVRFDQDASPLVIHACGQAKIVAAPRSLAHRGYRYLRKTFGGP